VEQQALSLAQNWAFLPVFAHDFLAGSSGEETRAGRKMNNLKLCWRWEPLIDPAEDLTIGVPLDRIRSRFAELRFRRAILLPD
jgi:hypothetical protein